MEKGTKEELSSLLVGVGMVGSLWSRMVSCKVRDRSILNESTPLVQYPPPGCLKLILPVSFFLLTLCIVYSRCSLLRTCCSAGLPFPLVRGVTAGSPSGKRVCLLFDANQSEAGLDVRGPWHRVILSLPHSLVDHQQHAAALKT